MRLIFYIFTFGLILSSCGQLTIEVENMPSNTPKDDQIFLAGNFNYWDPGDDRFTLKQKPDSSGYFITVPRGFGRLEYKFTRGDWKSVEQDRCGFPISNRGLSIFQDDTVFAEIGSWQDLKPADCEYVTLVIDDLPEETPDDEPITLAGDFNQWGMSDKNLQFMPDGRGRRILKLIKPKGINEIEFKIMRGNLSNVETDEFGNELPPRKLFLNESDSMFFKVENWADQAKKDQANLTIIIKSLPNGTPPDAEFYLATNTNKWYPRSENYKFSKQANGTHKLEITNIPFIEFKVTRGSWETVEVDSYGNEMPNRTLGAGISGSVKQEIVVQAWKDLKPFKRGKVHFIVDVPKSTEGEAIYMPNSFNNWDENDRNYKLEQLGDNRYYMQLEKRFERMQFKFVRKGNWNKVEVDEFGREIENRSFAFSGNDTVYFKIQNWRDRTYDASPQLTLVINDYPKTTPTKADIYLAAEFTGMYWSSNDDDFRFKKAQDGNYYLTVKKEGQGFEFKFTRGSWESVETDKLGYDIGNRYYQYSLEDTAYFTIDRWKDQ